MIVYFLDQHFLCLYFFSDVLRVQLEHVELIEDYIEHLVDFLVRLLKLR